MCDKEGPIALDLSIVDGLVSRSSFKHVGTYLFAANARSRADRAGAQLGYAPSAPGLMETLEEDLLAMGE